jgi:acyl-coenzyme A thioesterase PaaI-like protein
VTTIADSACGYAALSLMPAQASVLTVEYKVNLLSPARGALLIARGRVLRPGRSLTVCACDVVALVDGNEKPVATMLATMIAVSERPDMPHGM